MDHDMDDENEHGFNEYITNYVRKKAPPESLHFEETDVSCCFVYYRKYFVVHCGLVQVIEVGNGHLDRITSLRGDPVVLCNMDKANSNLLGSIRGPVAISMASRFVIDGDSRYAGYPKNPEQLWHMGVILRYYFPNYAAQGQALQQTGFIIVPYALAHALAKWIERRAPAVQVDWRLPPLSD